MRGALLLLALVGCANGYSEMRGQLPPDQADAFDACRDFMMARSCVASETGFYGQQLQAECVSRLATHYAGMRSLADRRAFLTESGCPASVVRQRLP